MFTFIQGGFLSEYASLEDAASDLSKALYGTRSEAENAAWLADCWMTLNPGQIPVVYDGTLLTGSQYEAELRREEEEREAARQAKIDARRQERLDWHNASPMREAMRKAGLLSA